jgi:hypothetical protein
MKATKPLTKAALIITSVLLSLLAAELLLRWAMPDDNRYYVWQPNLQHQFRPDSTVFNGIRGIKNFTINRQGSRGEQISGDTGQSAYNCLFLGGSTTECLYLDDRETWWHLWDSLTERDNFKIASASIGKSGITTRELYLHMKYYVPQLKHVQQVVIMPGLNDLMKRLSADNSFNHQFQFTPQIEDSLVNTIFLRKGRSTEKEWWRRTVLFQLTRNFYHNTKPNGVKWMIQDDNGEQLKQWRLNRKNASHIIDTLPDLTTALLEYERNLQLIYNEAKKADVSLVFITQPYLYKDTMTAQENNLLWMGGIGAYQKEGGHAYYSAKALKQGMEMYNQALRSFCLKNNIPLADTERIIPSDTSVFYDDCHFNENGARVFAAYLSQVKFQ